MFQRSVLKLLSITSNAATVNSRSGNAVIQQSSKVVSVLTARAYSYGSYGSEDVIKGKSAVVTGSTSGIGLGVAHALAARGCNIVLNGFADKETVDRIEADLQEKYGITTNYVDADLARHSDIENMCRQVLHWYPDGADILINNAGLQHVCEVVDFPTEKWDLLIAVMLTAPFHLTRNMLPYMKIKGWGRIVNIASIHGLVASPKKSAYVSAKHGIIGLTKVVALEAAGSGVTCNAVCPGFVNTDIFKKQVLARAEQENIPRQEAERRILELVHPTCQVVEVDQVGECVGFVCSATTNQMTGSILTMDAGWTAR